jgi:DNA-binding response OmpR family regulator
MKILIAVEDAALAQILEAEAQAAGHCVIVTADGQEALELALVEQPEAIVLAEQLPVFGGYEVATALRSDPTVPPRLPIVILTPDGVFTRIMLKTGITAAMPIAHDAQRLADILTRFAGQR